MTKRRFIFLVAFLYSSFCVAQNIDTIKVKVHDHIMTLYSSGVGKPTVILEAGGGSNHKETWEKVEAQLASFTKVVSYDRPGYLNSEKCNSTRDAVTVAKELKEALTKTGIKPPYILAGWSLGGSFVRVFAGLYPQDVSGLVLVDPAPENSYPQYEKDSTYLAEKKAHHDRLMSSNRVGQKGEWLAFDSSMSQGRRSDKLHSTPTTLLIAAGKADGGQDRDTTDPLNRIWVEELIKWAKKRPNLKYEIITNSGHHIARFQPETVVNAIRDHIRRYQAQALVQAATPFKKPEQLKDGIQTATLKEVGLDEKIIQQMTDSIINGNYPNIHSVLILRNNKLVYENYFPGYDQVRARGRTGFTDHHRDSLHDLRSVTKSFVGACVMIAVDQGRIKSLDQRVFDFFPEYARHDTGMKREITIRHLLTMSSGLDWNEHISYMDSTNSETRMDRSKDPVEFFLSQRLMDKPGTKFNYSAGCTHTLAVIVERTTGMSIDQFAFKNLFQPLGITDFAWVKRRDGIPITASGLRLRSRDMAKFGLLYLNGGKWNNKQVISSNAITQLSKEQLSTPYSGGPISKVGYSYQIWLYTYSSAGKSPVIQGNGNGGQIITIDKELDLVVIATAGNYNSRDIRKQSDELYPDFIYPAIIKK